MAVLLVLLLWLQAAGGSLTSSQKKEILHAHNYYRGHVDPIATNMRRMVSQMREKLTYAAEWSINTKRTFLSITDRNGMMSCRT